MKTLRQRSRRGPWHTIQTEFDNAIVGREEFRSGAMLAERVNGRGHAGGTGRAESPTTDLFRRDDAAGVIDYVIRSYATPIAWHTTDGYWIVPDDSYSVTTSRHQGFIRRALSGETTYRPDSTRVMVENER